ncbi:unnamed protein product [Ranitomeya imitator]|uniref:Uncharacterized protein n=1 Tax=Ranitomeya imitator TaxID=111125 RepID=A0ABN9KXI4_9NEOB|nr:unnamed protein product [Ranitomeya imitator]
MTASLAFLLLAGLLAGLCKAFDFGLTTRCVSIPKELGMCQDISYTEMRLPNLMGHTTIPEVVSKTAEWHKLLQTGCHPYAQMFLCSLFAPVCLDTRRDDMCLDNLSKEFQYIYKELPKPTCQGCPLIEETFLYRRVLDAFCDNDIAVKVQLAKRKFASGHPEYVTEGPVEFIKQGLLLPYDTRNLIEQWLRINDNCAHRMIRHSRSMVYILTGNIQHGKVVLTRVFHWQKKDSQLTLATRKWRHHKC